MPLGQFTLLVGPNGSGKTTVLDAVHQLGLMAAGKDFGEVFFGNHDARLLRHRGTNDEMTISVMGAVGGKPFSASVGCTFSISSAQPIDEALDDVIPVSKLAWSVGDATSTDVPGAISFADAQLGDQALTDGWRSWLRSTALYRLDARVIAAPASSMHRLPRVQFDGRDTAVALKAIKLGFDDPWSTILKLVRKVVPNVVSIGVEQVPAPASDPAPSASSHLAQPSGEWYRIVFEFAGVGRFPAASASEGTLLTLALITILSAPSRPNLILLDDVEQGLHPVAQIELVRQIKVLLDQDEMRNVQVIATTHSPYVLDAVTFEQVRVFALRPDGSAAMKSLAEHPDAARLRGKLSAGELWTSDPESKWV